MRHLQKYYTNLLREKTWRPALLLVVVLAGCARLPDYARPRFHESGGRGAAADEGFGYRTLAVEDFQAAALPPASSPYHRHINAHSCISIRPAGDTKARITQGVYEGRSFFVGSIPEVRFEAVFVPACSWWSPAVPEGRKAYVLQHEQIHFALAELSARRLTRQVREDLQDYLVVDDGYRAVQEELIAKIQALTRDAMEASFEEHTHFDEETSLQYDPRAQKRWWEEVEEKLAETTRP